jgi:hypothetical protein
MTDYSARLARGFATVCLVASTAACATVTRGTKQDFKVVSEPPGATVTTTYAGLGCPATPCTFKAPRKHGFEVTVTKTGYKPSVTHIDTKIAGGGTAGLAGNALIGGIIGIAVDANNGSMNDLTPNPLTVKLEPDGSAPATPSSGSPNSPN